MKIALCLAGQFRTFDSEFVYKSLKHFLLDKYDCDLFISTWDKRGISYCHGHVINERLSIQNENITEELITKNLKIKGLEIENYNFWENNLSLDQSHFMQLGGTHHKGCLPQLYKKMKVVNLLKRCKTKYDYIILTRPDLFLWNNIDLNLYQNQNTIYTFNLPNSISFHPNRIYDIFYMGKSEEVIKMSEAYFHINNLLDDPYHSNLFTTDCCKMLYIFAKKYCNFLVETTVNIPGDIFRGENKKTIEHYRNVFDGDQFLNIINTVK